MNKDRSLFSTIDPRTHEVSEPIEIGGALFVVVYTDGVDTHLHSVHTAEAKAIQTADDQALKMRMHRRKFMGPGHGPEAYVVIPAEAVHVSRV